MATGSAYPLRFDVDYPEHLSRWLIFVKWLLVIPHIIVLALYGIAYLVTLIIAWFAILFTGRYQRGLFDFAVGLLRWGARVTAYAYLMRDEYPPFSTGGEYPVRLEVDYPERLSRWLIFLKWLLIIPHLIIIYAYSMLASAIMFVSFFIILFTGRYPKALFDLVVGYYRWNNRVDAYVLLLTDQYPPFTNA
jgi:membrane protein YqaA with SNARE-associated domain